MIFLQQQGGGQDYGMLILMGGMFIVFYFFILRPQQKKAKDQKKFRDDVKKGDMVVTIGGLHGRISSVESDDTIILDVDKGTKLKFEKSAISMEYTKKYPNAAPPEKI